MAGCGGMCWGVVGCGGCVSDKVVAEAEERKPLRVPGGSQWTNGSCLP